MTDLHSLNSKNTEDLRVVADKVNSMSLGLAPQVNRRFEARPLSQFDTNMLLQRKVPGSNKNEELRCYS